MQRLTVFAVNTGIWPATFALLTVILVRVFRRWHAHWYLPYLPDPYNVATCLPIECALRCAVYPTLLGLLQHAAC